MRADEVARAREDVVEHRFGQPAGLGILPAGMIRRKHYGIG
jgi:hypothetical protein